MPHEQSHHPVVSDDLDQLCVNTIRFLAVDAVEKAKSGHPGAPMGLAPIAYVLWTRHLHFDPHDPVWFNRDRFMLSNGHASMLHYALLHLTGYDLSLDDLKQFRQFGSKTPGHPERGDTPGIEVTTGPLGQGFGNAVGMAIAEQFLASTFNKEKHSVIDHHTYVFMGDGCMEEGITSEAASLGGHLELGKLIAFYDDNGITIDGSTGITFTEDVAKRYEAYHWHVIDLPDPNDLESVDHAIRVAKSVLDKPSLIVCHTHIGYGSPNKQDSNKAHGNPLGKDEVILTKQHLNWSLEPDFYIPEAAARVFQEAGERGTKLHAEWNEQFAAYKIEYAKHASTLTHAIERRLPDGWDDELPIYKPTDGPVATRTTGGKAMNIIARTVPTLTSGSADLNESTFTKLESKADHDEPSGWDDFEPSMLKHGSYHGRTINFGIREHAMGAIVNGMAAHGGIWPSGSTFFCFSDYMRPAVRLSAIMNIPSIFVWTHDSVAVGEDGPTHEPVEHLASLRAIPNFTMIRPADANETVEAWRCVMNMRGPVGLALTRQRLPIIDQEKYASARGLSKGAYILSEAMSAPEIILIATGSEVSLALGAQIELEKMGILTRVVSMPCWEFFEAQPEHYRNLVLPPDVTCRLSIELGTSFGWDKWVGPRGASLSVDHFGTSSPYEKILEAYGFTVPSVVHFAERLLRFPDAAREELRALQQRFTTHKNAA